MINGGVNLLHRCSLADFIKNSPTCVNFSDYIHPHYPLIAKEKGNIFVGFGFVSHRHGLSENVPIDIYTMLLTAEKIRREVSPKGAKVHVLIADHFAYLCEHETCKNKDKVTQRANKYLKKLINILSNLEILDHYVIHFSSNIVEREEFKAYKEKLEKQAQKIEHFMPDDAKTMSHHSGQYTISKDTWDILHASRYGQYEPSNRHYFLEQTALGKFFYDILGCGIKVSWTKAHRMREIKNSKSFDEAHFDRFYRDLFFDEENKLSFIYTKSGFAANRIDERAKTIPYTAPPDPEVVRIILSSKQELPKTMQINSDLIKSVAENATILTAICSEVAHYRVDTTLSVSAFYHNANYLRLFAKSKEKHLAIRFHQLQINDENDAKNTPKY